MEEVGDAVGTACELEYPGAPVAEAGLVFNVEDPLGVDGLEFLAAGYFEGFLSVFVEEDYVKVFDLEGAGIAVKCFPYDVSDCASGDPPVGKILVADAGESFVPGAGADDFAEACVQVSLGIGGRLHFFSNLSQRREYMQAGSRRSQVEQGSMFWLSGHKERWFG